MNKWSPGTDNCWATSFFKSHSTDPNNWFSTFLEQAWESWDSDSQLSQDPTIWIQLLKKTKFNCAPCWTTIFPFNWIGSNWVDLSCVPCTVSKKLLTLLAVICLTSIATWGTNIGTLCLMSPEVISIYFFSLRANILFFFISLLFLLNMKSFSIPMKFSKNVPDHSSYNQHSQCILGWLELTKSTYILKMFSLMGNSLMGQEYC